MKLTRKNIVVALMSAGVISGGALSASAQQATTANTPAKVEKIEVTGSNIKRIDAEGSAPITVITAEEIRQSGKQTITELLRELPFNASGGLTELSGSNSFSAGAASVSLRGLGSTATLVLLNGRRVAPFSSVDPNFGQSGVVNLNALPLDVIERVEILKDGASAIYGSEAIAGVINIILRKDYKGGQVGATTTANKDGLYKTYTGVGTIGFGDLAKDKYNVFFNVEAYKQDRVMIRQADSSLNRQEFRNTGFTWVPTSAYSPFITYITNGTGATAPAAGSACPTANVIPASTFLGVATGTQCLYDQFQNVAWIPDIKRASAFSRGSIDLTPTTSVFAELNYTAQKTLYPGAPSVAGQGSTGPTVNGLTGTVQLPPSTLAVGHPNNPFGIPVSARVRFDGVGQRNTELENKSMRALVGVKSVIGTWDVESAFLFDKNTIDWTTYNQLRYDMIVRAFGPNGYNFNSPNTGGVTADMIRVNLLDKGESKYSIWDVKGSSEIAKLAGGAAVLALGAEYRKETRLFTPDRNTLNGNSFQLGAGSADGTRNVASAYAEVVLPLLKNVEVQLAGRYDRYSDYGSSRTPKIAASWAALPTFKLRGSYATGFRAPSLSEISKSSVTSFLNGVNDPLRCRPASAPTAVAGCNQAVGFLIQANTQLTPERARTASAGFVWEPMAEASVSVDYFSITRENEVSTLSATDILANEGSTNPIYANRIIRDRNALNIGVPIPNDPGTLVYIRGGFVNNGETTVRGFDVDSRYRINLGSAGRLTLAASATRYTDSRSSGVSGDPQISNLGFLNSPAWRGNVRASWQTGDWTTTSTVNYVGSFKTYFNPEALTAASATLARNCGDGAGSPSFATYLGRCAVKEYVTVDLGTEYRGFKNWRINASIRNLANERPSFDPRNRPMNLNWYQPQGINFALGARYSWN
jgi:iron complex outermembrane recepter protein